MEGLLDRFEKCISTQPLAAAVAGKERLIVAYSGGADSSLLLHLAVRYFIPRGVQVEAAHLDHMIRQGEAERDRLFCEETCRELGIRLHVRRADIPSLAAAGGSLEEVARRERYSFFRELLSEAESVGVRGAILTAHNADDNLETVIFNLARGASLRGMCGIPPVRDGVYLRPLLSFSGEEIRRLCGEYNIPFVNDSTNFETDYTRNHIRHHVTPAMRRIVPDPQNAVARMTASLRTDADYLEMEADRAFSSLGEVPSDVSLASLHDAILSRVLLRMYDSAQGGAGQGASLEKRHIDEIISHVRGHRGAFSLSVPGGISFRSDAAGCRFVSADSAVGAEPDKSVCELEMDCPVTKNGFTVLLTRDLRGAEAYKNENIYNLSIHKALNFDKIKGKLKFRTRVEGDVFRFGGMTRKVKKLLSEKKLPPELRESIPVIADDGGILWIPTFPVRDDVRAAPSCDAAYLVCFSDRLKI